MAIKDTKCTWTLNVIARLFVGFIFLFSSFVKGVDPLGTSYKITEYLTSWQFGSITFEWMVPMSTVLSMCLIVAEFIIGMLLIFGSFRRLTAWSLVLMMLFFTVTTLIDAITNKVSDCGCFGDAVKLTNWQTFWKNIVLNVPTVWIFLTRNLRTKRRFERDVLITAFSIILMVIFGLYNISNEPCVDFRAWKVGNQMIEMDESLQIKSYVTYRNTETGKSEEFLSEELVKKMEDPTWEEKWEWVSSRVADPHEIKADGFSMLDLGSNDFAQEFIGSPDYIIIATIHHLDKINEQGITALHHSLSFAQESGIQMVLLTSSLPEDAENFLFSNKLDNMEFYFTDATAIKTMLRSNPGFILLKNGKVLGKWHYRHYRGLLEYSFQ